LGATLTKTMRFTMPATFRQRVFRDWLGILAVSGGLIAIAGPLFGYTEATKFGVSVIVMSVALLWLQQWIGQVLAGRGSLGRCGHACLRNIVLALAILAFVFMGLGASEIGSWLQEAFLAP
jgi:hypothetical protein